MFKKEGKLPQILGLTASPINAKIKEKGSKYLVIKQKLQELSNNINCSFCPLKYEFLDKIQSSPNISICEYDGIISTSFANSIMQLVYMLLELFFPYNPEKLEEVNSKYYNFLSENMPSQQLPDIKELMLIDVSLTFCLILIIRKGIVLLTELGIWAFHQFIQDIIEELVYSKGDIEKIRVNLKNFCFILTNSQEYYEEKHSPKLLQTLKVLENKKMLLSRMSLILFVKDKITCVYLSKLLLSEKRNYTSDYIYGNTFKLSVIIIMKPNQT